MINSNAPKTCILYLSYYKYSFCFQYMDIVVSFNVFKLVKSIKIFKLAFSSSWQEAKGVTMNNTLKCLDINKFPLCFRP